MLKTTGTRSTLEYRRTISIGSNLRKYGHCKFSLHQRWLQISVAPDWELLSPTFSFFLCLVKCTLQGLPPLLMRHYKNQRRVIQNIIRGKAKSEWLWTWRLVITFALNNQCCLGDQRHSLLLNYRCFMQLRSQALCHKGILYKVFPFTFHAISLLWRKS